MKKLHCLYITANLALAFSALGLEKEIIFTQNAPAPIGAYSQAVKLGNTVYISGQIPINPENSKMISGDFNQQAKQTIANLSAVAKASGGDLGDIVKLTVYLTDLSNFSAFNKLMEQNFPKPYPARAVVEVGALAENSPIEIDAIMQIKAGAKS